MAKRHTIKHLKDTALALRRRADGGGLGPNVEDRRREDSEQTLRRWSNNEPLQALRTIPKSRLARDAGINDIDRAIRKDQSRVRRDPIGALIDRTGYADGGAPELDQERLLVPGQPTVDDSMLPTLKAGIGKAAEILEPEYLKVPENRPLPTDRLEGKIPSNQAPGLFSVSPFIAGDLVGNFSGLGLGKAALAASAPIAKRVAPMAEKAAQYVRDLSPLGLYSHAAEVAANLPQAKGTPQQFRSMLEKAGVKPEEFRWSGWDSIAGQPVLTKEQVQEAFTKGAPKVAETRLSGEEKERWQTWDMLSPDEKQDEFNAFREMFDSPAQFRREYRTRAEQWDAAANWFNERQQLDPVSAVGAAKFKAYTLPGGENYREVLLTLPRSPASEADIAAGKARTDISGNPVVGETFSSSHWDEPNVLAHIRMSDRSTEVPGWAWRNKKSGNTTKTFESEEAARAHLETLPEHLRPDLELAQKPHNQKVLHLEELQSDWAQQGRKKGFKSSYDASLQRVVDAEKQMIVGSQKGLPRSEMARLEQNYTDEQARHAREFSEGSALPDAPYVTNTSNWTDLALKRALREAAEGGYDRMVWTPGEAQAARYNLSKQVNSIHATKNPDGTFLLTADPKGGRGRIDLGANVPPEKLSEIVGKELADKIANQKQLAYIYDGENLRVGGEGMKGYYDKIVPNQLGKLIKKLDPEAKVEPFEIQTSKGKKFQLYDGDTYIDDFDTREQAVAYARSHDHDRRGLVREEKNPQAKSEKMLGIRITPKMREAIMKGLPAFSVGGVVLTPVEHNPFASDRAKGGRVNPANIDRNPTEAQKEAGNYAKDHVNIAGLDITIENAKGHWRSGVGANGRPWRVRMPAAYGYIRRTEGKDGDHVDVYLGPAIRSQRVFVVNQKDAESGRFDEHKCFLGFGSLGQVKATYRKGFSDGKANDRMGPIVEMTIAEFKHWLHNGNTKKELK